MPSLLYPNIYLYKRIVQAKLFIDNNYAEDIDLDNIADEAYFSKFHFIRLFTKIYGKTPYQYLIKVRIEKAIQLLRSDMPVSNACYAVGFESVGSFSTLFKKDGWRSAFNLFISATGNKSTDFKNTAQFYSGMLCRKNGWKKK